MPRGPSQLGKVEPKGDIGTREEMLQILTEMARNGSVTAATTLVRELRQDEEEPEDEVGAAIDRILAAKRAEKRSDDTRS